MSTPRAGGGRRAATRSRRRGPEPLLVIGLLLVALTATALALMSDGATPSVENPPQERPLTASTLVCPPALTDEPIRVTTTGEASGPVTVGDRSIEVAPGVVAAGQVPAAAVVRANGDLAPGLVAARTTPGGARSFAGAACVQPGGEQWFTGAGAGARHASVLTLVNAGAGPAVADVQVHGSTGPVSAPGLVGVVVPAGESREFDLAAVLPRRDALTLRVSTSRGRLAATMTDLVDELGEGARSSDWLPAGVAPTTSSDLLGLASGRGVRTLMLSNPGSDEARVSVRVIGADAIFSPDGVEEIRVPPESTVRTTVSGWLNPLIADDARGLRIEGTLPVTATLRSVVEGELSTTTAGVTFHSPTVGLVPGGRSRLLLTAAGATEVVAVARDDNGEELATERLQIRADTGVELALPGRTTRVELTPTDAGTVPITGAVLTDRRQADRPGTAVVLLRDLLLTGLVPDVRPGS